MLGARMNEKAREGTSSSLTRGLLLAGLVSRASGAPRFARVAVPMLNVIPSLVDATPASHMRPGPFCTSADAILVLNV
jgi:hypothetical protein